ncbi:hypothetical protein GCM10007276_22900 [Agaricicola taiwanensis]|uniref:DUF192 domain-containing protein n=1 Tax=Agaricicola taiwanensis TaxID=591372 RepID=A0A8J2YIC3_9RHOB|nr:DUF192 domain-containing protein [Agaricicola taiwanensis]GGE45147.1 hypothetical protein GCM10007276_22900 [Agaricicola taiwanensis]
MTRWRLLLVCLIGALGITAAIAYVSADRGVARLATDELAVDTAGGTHIFTVELARTDEERARGLMFRTELSPDRGMLFDFVAERPVAMWMRNTYVPLDMFFIASNGIVVNIARDTVPLSERTVESAAPVRYVLEVPAGTAKRIGAASGDRVRHAAIDN